MADSLKNHGQPKIKNASSKPSRSMAATFKSFLDNARQTISGATTPTPGTPPNNTSITQLFPKVDPKVDGDDCDHDCDSCSVKYPRTFKIHEDDKLYGHVKGWSTHVLVATGKTDWVRDVADEKGSVMEAIDKKAVAKPSNGVCLAQTLPSFIANSELETYALRVEYTHAFPFLHLRPTDHRPPPARFRNH